MQTQATQVPSMVTIHEAMAGLIWASQSRPTRKVFEDIEQEAATTGEPKALADFYRRLDGCQVEDWLGARIAFLDKYHLWRTNPDNPHQFEHMLVVQEAIDELDALRAKLPEFEKEFHNELCKENSRIQVSQSPTGVARYLARSVALWAREQLGIIISEWEDFSNYNLYEDGLRQEAWAEEAQREAHLHVLNAVLHAALGAEIPERSDRIPPKGLRLQFKTDKKSNHPGKINEEGFIAFIEHQFYRITDDADRTLLPRETSRKLLEKWAALSYLSSRMLDPYGAPKQKCVQYMIAGLVIGLAEDQFAKDLRTDKPLNWQMPSTFESIDLNRIDHVHPRTAHQIVRTCIDRLLKKASATRQS